MKTVLILAYDYPPHTSVAAARPKSWFQHFSKYGLYPVVVTRHWDTPMLSPEDTIRKSKIQQVITETTPSGTVIRVPFTPWHRIMGPGQVFPLILLRKTISFLISFLRFLSFHFDPDKAICREAGNYLKNNKVDCILATGEPFFLFRYAALLSKEYGIPWIADYRDGWSENQLNFFNKSMLNRLRVRFNRIIEKRIVSQATAITAAAPSYLQSVRNTIETLPLSKVIFNGFENTDSGNRSHAHMNPEFTIVYSGRLYPHYPVEEFLDALSVFLNQYPERKLVLHCLGLAFYPEEAKRLEHKLVHANLSVRISHRLVYSAYMEMLKNAHICLLFGVQGMSWLNAKIFDYFYAGRKIFLYKNDQAILESLINETESGVCCSNSSDLRNELNIAYRSFEHTGDVSVKPHGIEKYSRENQAHEMTKLIKQCVE